MKSEMNTTIRLEARWPENQDLVPKGTCPEGMEKRRDSYVYEGKHHEFEVCEYTHEFAPARYFKDDDNIVLSFGEQNYLLVVKIDSDDGIPDSALIILAPTTEPETMGEQWDEQAAIAQYIKREEDQIADECEFDPDWIERRKKSLERFKEDPSLRHPFGVKVFGTPDFIQNAVFPVHDGKLAYNLITLETGWGDSGNVNILFACDESGTPCKVWFEASCC
jgi:hypothetical protein